MGSHRWEGIDEFAAVAQEGSFQAAADRLRVSSSHVSRQVARLEERLQTRLLYRTTRRVSLTEAGRTFLTRCQHLIDEREQAFSVLGEMHRSPTGLLRMTAAVAYGERFVVPLVNDFMSQHPQLKLELELTNRTVDIIQEGYDLAIRLGRLTESRLVATRLAPRAMHLCAAPEYIARYGRPHTLSELSRHNCLLGTGDIWTFDQGGRTVSFRPAGNWRCNSGQAVLDAALRGFGICQLPDYYVQAPLQTGELVALLPASQPPDTAVWAVYPQQRLLSPKVSKLVEALKAGLAGRPEYAANIRRAPAVRPVGTE